MSLLDSPQVLVRIEEPRHLMLVFRTGKDDDSIVDVDEGDDFEATLAKLQCVIRSELFEFDDRRVSIVEDGCFQVSAKHCAPALHVPIKMKSHSFRPSPRSTTTLRLVPCIRSTNL